MARLAGRVSWAPSASSNLVMTGRLSKPVIYFDTGSSSFSLPSSRSIMIATEVIGLVIEAMLKMASTDMGTLRSASSLPAAPSYSTPSRSTTSAVTPAVSSRATAAWSRSVSAWASSPLDLATEEAGRKVPSANNTTRISTAGVPKAMDLAFMASGGILVQF